MYVYDFYTFISLISADLLCFRCRVISVYIDNMVLVEYVDHNDTDLVPLANVRPLPSTYNTLPYQAVKCRLAGLEQYPDDERLLLEVKRHALGKTFVATVEER